jgi:hypothetical protein
MCHVIGLIWLSFYGKARKRTIECSSRKKGKYQQKPELIGENAVSTSLKYKKGEQVKKVLKLVKGNE